jgi:CheY-like chemotaxis protein
VQDSGAGIEPLVRLNMFDPFFTTKFAGRGLGLAAVSGIVRSLNGAIAVDSMPEKGTTFRVILPAGNRPDAERAARKHPILVVDDEVMVRRTAEAILRKRGHEVLVAESGMAAIEQFRRQNGEIALVLLDMSMPRMSGEEAFRQMKSVRPDVPVIVCSGYSEQEAVRRFGGLGVAGFIQKPYTAQALMERIGAVLKI